jgi:mersacidin/lichenicidin family type 2 lantibiotic
MQKIDVVRAWKDARYRQSLTPAERAELPQHPAGLVELSDEDLKSASGLGGPTAMTTAITCTEYTWRSWKACGCGEPVTTAITCTEYTFAGMKACCP